MAEESQTPQNLNSDLLNQGTTDMNDFRPFGGQKLDMSNDMFHYKPIVPSLTVNQLPIKENIVGYPPNTNKPNSNKGSIQDFLNYMTNGIEKLQSNKSYIRPHAYDASSQGANKARYKSYGQKTYDRIGFNPEINNELMYNSKTSGADELVRMFQHSGLPLLIKGAIAGPKSYYQMAHGNFGADPDEAADYEDAANLGYSTKGGLLGFTNNLLNSFFYSLGILAEGAIEGAVVGGALGSLAGPGGTATGVGAGAIEGGITSLLKAPKALWNIAESGAKLLRQLDNLKDVSKAKEFFNTAVKSTGKFLNPVNNITDFAILTKTDEFKNLSNLAKTSKGFGAFYFDLRNINMALSEGRLEGGMKENETYKEMYDKYYNKYGEAPSDDLQRQYRKVANNVGFWTTMKNAALINYTNKLTVPNIMQGSARRLLAAPEKVLELKGFNVMLDPKAGFEVVEQNFKNSLKALRHPGTYGKMGLGYFKRNLFEGLQEVGQDIIGESTKNYYMDSYYDPAKATFDYSIGTIGSAMRKQLSAQGWDTFASGFAMGFLQGGVDTVFSGISKKASAGYNKHFNKDKYAEYQADLAETKQRAQDVVDELNTLYKDPVEFFNSKYFNYGAQSRIARIHDDEEADTKEVKDAKDAAFISSIYSMLETGTVKYFVDNFKNLQQQSPTELEQSLKLKQGEGEKALQKMDAVIDKVKRMEKTHAFWTEKMKSPINLGQYKKDTPQYEMAAIFQKAWQRGQFNAIFLDESFKENLSRINSINNALGELSGSQIININDIQLVTDPERFLTEVDLLREEIAVLKTLKDDKSKKQATQKTSKLEAMLEMMEDYTKYDQHFISKSVLKDRIKTIKEKEGLSDKDAEIKALQEVDKDLTDSGIDYKQKYKDSFIKYLKTLVPNEEDLIQVENGLVTSSGIKNLDDAFNYIIDYHKLSNENKGIAKYINLFLTPEGFAEHVKRNFDWMKNLYLNREDYVRDTVNKSIMDLEYNDLLAELADEDIYVDLDEFADWIEDHNNKPSHFVQESNKRIIPEGSELYNIYYDKFVNLAEKYTEKPAGPALTPDEKLKKLIEEKEQQKQAELDDAKIAFNTQLKNETGLTEEEIRNQKAENETQNTQELQDAKANIDNLKSLLEQIKKTDVIAEELQTLVDSAIDNKITTADELNLYIQTKFQDEAFKNSSAGLYQDLVDEGVDANEAFKIVAYKLAFPELIKEKIKATETEIEQLSESETETIDIEATDAWKDYQQQVKKIEAEYEQIFADLINDFKKTGAKASTVEEVKSTPTRITVNTPWDNLPADLQVVLQKEFDKYAAAKYPNEDPASLAIIRQNWLPTQSIAIDAYNNAQVGTQKTETELIAKIPKLKSISDKLLDGRSLDQLSMRELRAILPILNGKLEKTKDKKIINTIKADIVALTKYIIYASATRKPTNKLEGIVSLLNDRLLARQDEIDVLFTDGTKAGDVKSIDELLSKTKKGYIFDNGKVPQRVTELVEEIETEEKNKKAFTPSVAKNVVDFYDTIIFDDSIKEDKKLDVFLDGLKQRIEKRFSPLLTLKKFEVIKAELEKEFTRESVLNTISDAAYSQASSTGTLIDGLIRDVFNGNKLVKPAEMSELAFKQLFGFDGIITLIKDEVLDGKYMVYANNLNVFDKNLGENGLAGEMDLLVVDADGNISIIDIKTSTEKTWSNFNTEDPGKFSKKYNYSVQQTIYRNLLYNMTGKKATIKLLPIELDYTVDGYIKSAKIADIVDKGKNTLQLIPVDEVDNYVPLKDIKEITEDINTEERSIIQQTIDSLKLDLESAEGEFADPELAKQLTQEIADLQAILDKEKGLETPPTTDAKADVERRSTKVISSEIVEKGSKKGQTRIITQTNSVENVEGTLVSITEYEAKVGDTTVTLGGRRMTFKEFKEEFPLDEDYEEILGDWPDLNDDTIITVRKVKRTPSNSRFKTVVSIYSPVFGDKMDISIKENDAKYDAELAALEGTPVDTTKTTIEEAKKIIKPTTGLGDLLVEVDEEGDLKISDFDEIIKPMSSAKNADTLMIAYADAMIAITEGNVPGDKDALANAVESFFKDKQVKVASRKVVSDKILEIGNYLIAKNPIFDNVRSDLFIVESVKDNKVKIKSLRTNKAHTVTNEQLKDNFRLHDMAAYEVKEETVVTPEDKAAVVETKNNLDDVKKDAIALNNAKENSKSMSKSDRLSKLKNNSNKC